MADPVRIPHWVQFVVYATQQGEEVVNTFNYESNPDVSSPQQATSLAETFWNHIATAYKFHCPPQTNFARVVCKTLYPQPDNYAGEYNIPQPSPGTSEGAACPANSAPVLSTRTGVIGRSFRGRNFLFPPADTNVDGSFMNSTVLSRMATIALLLLGYHGSGIVNLNWVVASRKLELLIQISSVILDYFMDSHRTRLPGPGR